MDLDLSKRTSRGVFFCGLNFAVQIECTTKHLFFRVDEAFLIRAKRERSQTALKGTQMRHFIDFKKGLVDF